MIIGTGIDVIEVYRIEKNLTNNKFINKIYTLKEIEYITSKKKNSQTAAGIFAAKEAVAKALGTGISSFKWTDVEVYHDKEGAPKIILFNEARKIALLKGIRYVHISITHIKETALALAVAEGKKEFNKDFNNTEYENSYGIINALENIKKRKKDTHKGTYGKIAVIAGSRGMAGAAYLSCNSALRAGSGLVFAIVPKSLESIMSMKLTEVIVKGVNDNNNGFLCKSSLKEIIEIVSKCDVAIIGPGIGTNMETKSVVIELIKNLNIPLIIDADGLNCIIDDKELLKEYSNKIIITPHPGEMKKLTEKKIIDLENKVILAKDFSYNYNVVTVLKGHNTVIASPDGNYFINSTGNPGMATAGSGDVLSGIIASLLGQGIDALNAAACGTYLHGLAGDLASEDKGEYGLIAGDILNNIPYAFKSILQFGGLVE